MLRPARQRLLSGVEIEDRGSASLWGYLVQYCWVYKLSIEGFFFFLCCTIFLNVLKNKEQLLSPDDNSRFAIYVKELLWNENPREHRPTAFGVPSVSSEQDEDAAESYAEAYSG